MVQPLTEPREEFSHFKQVHVADKCELGVYSCFNDPFVQSQTFKRPSDDKSAKNRPLLSKAQGHLQVSMFHCTWGFALLVLEPRILRLQENTHDSLQSREKSKETIFVPFFPSFPSFFLNFLTS